MIEPLLAEFDAVTAFSTFAGSLITAFMAWLTIKAVRAKRDIAEAKHLADHERELIEEGRELERKSQEEKDEKARLVRLEEKGEMIDALDKTLKQQDARMEDTVKAAVKTGLEKMASSIDGVKIMELINENTLASKKNADDITNDRHEIRDKFLAPLMMTVEAIKLAMSGLIHEFSDHKAEDRANFDKLLNK